MEKAEDYVISNHPLPSSQPSEVLQLLQKENIPSFFDYIDNLEPDLEGGVPICLNHPPLSFQTSQLLPGALDDSPTSTMSTLTHQGAQELNRSLLMLGFESLIDPEPDPFDSQSDFRKPLTLLSSVNLRNAVTVPPVPGSSFTIIEAPQSLTVSSVCSFNEEHICPLLKKPDLNSDQAVRRCASADIYPQPEVTYWPLRRSLSESSQEFSILLNRNSGYRTVSKGFKTRPLRVLSNFKEVLSTLSSSYHSSPGSVELQHSHVPPVHVERRISDDACSSLMQAPSEEFYRSSTLLALERDPELRKVVPGLNFVPAYLYRFGTIDKVPWRTKIKDLIHHFGFTVLFVIKDHMRSLSPSRLRSLMHKIAGLVAVVKNWIKGFVQKSDLIVQNKGLLPPGSNTGPKPKRH